MEGCKEKIIETADTCSLGVADQQCIKLETSEEEQPSSSVPLPVEVNSLAINNEIKFERNESKSYHDCGATTNSKSHPLGNNYVTVKKENVARNITCASQCINHRGEAMRITHRGDLTNVEATWKEPLENSAAAETSLDKTKVERSEEDGIILPVPVHVEVNRLEIQNELKFERNESKSHHMESLGTLSCMYYDSAPTADVKSQGLGNNYLTVKTEYVDCNMTYGEVTCVDKDLTHVETTRKEPLKNTASETSQDKTDNIIHEGQHVKLEKTYFNDNVGPVRDNDHKYLTTKIEERASDVCPETLENCNTSSRSMISNSGRKEIGPTLTSRGADDCDVPKEPAGIYNGSVCPYCTRTFNTNHQLVPHIRTHTGERPFSCNRCDKRFIQQGHLTEHIRSHNGDKRFRCLYCIRRFNQKSNLKGHVRIHTGEKPFTCAHCDQKYSHKASLTRHALVHTGERPFFCFICDKKFTVKYDLSRHMLTHVEFKPILCPHCGKGFQKKRNLTAHIRTHAAELPFCCPKCDKKYCEKVHLKCHLRTHSAEKCFSCTHCNKSFYDKSHLKAHLQVHTGERGFPCPQCEKRFRDKTDLTVHMRTHTGERPFPCGDCMKRFSTKSGLTRHMRGHVNREKS